MCFVLPLHSQGDRDGRGLIGFLTQNPGTCRGQRAGRASGKPLTSITSYPLQPEAQKQPLRASPLPSGINLSTGLKAISAGLPRREQARVCWAMPRWDQRGSRSSQGDPGAARAAGR